MEGGGRAGRAGDRDEEEGARPGASRHTNSICSGKNWSNAELLLKRCFDKEHAKMCKQKYIALML
jgi:hypothetical protein